MQKLVITFALLALPVLLTGCSKLGVKPWERGILAQQEMNIISEPIESSFDDHIYFSKEASSGGQSTGGGGCGCN